MLTGKLRSQVNKIIRDPKMGMVTAKICRQHAFTSTALLRALKTAREQGGVLAPAQFVWLRAVDRNLWYPLNNLGRAASHIEAAAAMSHFRAELAANKPIPNPQVDPAIIGLEEYLAETGAVPPVLDHSHQQKKRK